MAREETISQRRRRKMIFARILRKNMTQAESMLWKSLRSRKLAELKFRRQSPIEWFVVDFLCMKHNLVVEVDGGIHEQQKEYDREREDILHSKGFRILRFSNERVMTD